MAFGSRADCLDGSTSPLMDQENDDDDDDVGRTRYVFIS